MNCKNVRDTCIFENCKILLDTIQGMMLHYNRKQIIITIILASQPTNVKKGAKKYVEQH